MSFKELKEEIISQLENYHPLTGAEKFYLDYLTAEFRTLSEKDIEIFYKDLVGISTDNYITYNFQLFLKKLVNLLKENYSLE